MFILVLFILFAAIIPVRDKILKNKGFEPNAFHLSKWYEFDMLFCAVTMFFNLWLLISTYEKTGMAAADCISLILAVVVALKRFYYRENKSDKPKGKTAVGIIRLIVVLCVTAVTVMPYSIMRMPVKQLYPVQRTYYLANFDKNCVLHEALPKNIPENADYYDADFVPSVLQARGGIDIAYYTDSDTIAEYRAIAEIYNAKRYIIGAEYEDEKDTEKAESLREWLEIRLGMNDTDGVEIYIFDYRDLTYVINENTGYFRLYY